MINELKRCPSPTCPYLAEHLVVAGHSEVGYWVVCRGCHARGPRGRYPDAAIELWNALPREETK